jgi:hypothetical protein
MTDILHFESWIGLVLITSVFSAILKRESVAREVGASGLRRPFFVAVLKEVCL